MLLSRHQTPMAEGNAADLAPEDDGATGHLGILDQVIESTQRAAEHDPRAREIQAAAVTLRDVSGRDRLDSFRAMAPNWGVKRREKKDAGWKDRPIAAIAKELEAAVLAAAQKWRRGPENPDTKEHPAASGSSGGSVPEGLLTQR